MFECVRRNCWPCFENLCYMRQWLWLWENIWNLKEDQESSSFWVYCEPAIHSCDVCYRSTSHASWMIHNKYGYAMSCLYWCLEHSPQWSDKDNKECCWSQYETCCKPSKERRRNNFKCYSIMWWNLATKRVLIEEWRINSTNSGQWMCIKSSRHWDIE